MRGTNKLLLFYLICCVSSYFHFIANILCGLCSHSSSRSQRCYGGSWGAPSGPLQGETWIGTLPLFTLPNVSRDGQETCWAPLCKWFGRGCMSMNYRRISDDDDDDDNDDGQAFVCAPSPPDSGQCCVCFTLKRSEIISLFSWQYISTIYPPLSKP